MRKELLVFADYFQIYIEDKSSVGQYEVGWSDEEIESMIYVGEGAIVLSTARNMKVPFSIELIENKPILDYQSWDHIVECSISSKEGVLYISGTTDYMEDVFKFSLPKGLYNAYVLYAGLSTINEDGLEGEDSYSLILWQTEEFIPRRVLKQWKFS
jgi:hypothetical protein